MISLPAYLQQVAAAQQLASMPPAGPPAPSSSPVSAPPPMTADEYAKQVALMSQPPAPAGFTAAPPPPPTPAGPVSSSALAPRPTAMTPDDYAKQVAFLSQPNAYHGASAEQMWGPQAPPAQPGVVNPFSGAGEDARKNAIDAINRGVAAETHTAAAPATAPTAAGAAWGGEAGSGFPLVQIPGGGGAVTIPAHETELRGPQLREAQQRRNEAVGNAIEDIQQRSTEQAAIDGAIAQGRAQRAYAAEDAANASAAERADELQERQKDFDGTVKQMAQASLDPNRFWATRTTPQTVSSVISIMLGGFLQGVKGGSNPGLDMINQYIDRDIHAQEFDYAQKRNVAEAKQTAFGMAMQKYQNVDAARAAARAAALDSVQAEMQVQAAKSRSVNAQNIASLAAADLQNDRMNQIAQGVAFTPAHQVAAPRRYLDPQTGFIYSENEAHEIAKEGRTQGFEYGKLGLGEYMKQLAAHQDEADKGAQYISGKLGEANIPQTREQAEQARQALVAHPLTTTERASPWVTGGLTSMPIVHKALFGQEAQDREDAWKQFKVETMKNIAGPRGIANPEIVKQLSDILDSAGDQASRLKAIERVESVVNEQEKTIRAGATPGAQKQYEVQRGAANTGGPGGVPTGTKKGWGE